ncbi:putative ribonuclease H-like domain-containing protein, partial [Tanacetum coccineum]
MAGWKPKDLKNKSFANIQELFDKAFKRVNTFVDFRIELVEGTEMEESSKKAEVMEESSSKRAGDELQQENLSRIGINKWYQSFALRNFDLEDMEFESTNSGTTAKLPILKLVTKMSIPVTAEEKTNKKNDVKARSLLLMALPNEYQLTFSQYPDSKSMFAAIETRFGESLDSIFNRLQKIVSRLAILGVVIAQEDLNSKFLSFYHPEWNTHVKKSVGASSGAQNLAFMTAPSTSSTNDANTASLEVSNASPNVNTASPQDLEQIHEDDLKAMDLKCNQEAMNVIQKYQDNTRKQGNNEDTSSKAMLAIDGVGFDWSDMAEEQVQTNMALMAFSDSEVYNDKTCSKTCLKNYETLKKQCDDLIVKLNQTEFTAATYKRGLATVEEQLITYRKNEVLFSEEVAVLKREVACKDYEINVLKSEFEKVKQEKEGIEFKIEKFDNASKSLNKLLGLDLSYSSLDEFKDPEFKSYGSEDSKQESNIVCDKKSDDSKENYDDSLVKEQVLEDTSSFVESSLNVDKETVFLVDKKKEFSKSKNHEKPVKKSFRPKAVNTARPNSIVVNAIRVNQANAGKPQQDDIRFIDSGYSRHMTGNIAYLSDFKKFDGGYVTFGGGAHGGRISGKGTLKTDSLNFKDATLDESMLWHRRLGHINLKNINKLVNDNLVR